MARRPLDACPACGVTVVYARDPYGLLMPFDRHSPDIETTPTRWVLTPALPGFYPLARDTARTGGSVLHNEVPALPHRFTCSRRRVPKSRRFRQFAGR